MSFAGVAALLSGQRPFHLYRFARGGQEALYTSRPEPITRTVAGVTGTEWAPQAIAHSRIPDTDQAFRAEVKVRLPLSDPWAFSLVGAVEFEPVTVAIWRGFLNDTSNELVPIFRGQVLGVQPQEGGLIELSCMTDIAAMQRKGLSAVMQRPCRHSVYGRGCGLVLSEWQTAGAVLSVAGAQVAVEGADAQPDGFYRGGVFSWDGRLAMIMGHAGEALTLAGVVPGLSAASAEGPVEALIAPGCQLTREVCASRFNNINNFGGFPWISDNPFDGRQVF